MGLVHCIETTEETVIRRTKFKNLEVPVSKRCVLTHTARGINSTNKRCVMTQTAIGINSTNKCCVMTQAAIGINSTNKRCVLTQTAIGVNSTNKRCVMTQTAIGTNSTIQPEGEDAEACLRASWGAQQNLGPPEGWGPCTKADWLTSQSCCHLGIQRWAQKEPATM